MEEPLSKVLAKMERAGVKVDLRQLDHFAQGLRKELEERQAHIREMVGEPDLNISSPKQVGDILFDKLKLDPKAKKSARGQYSTDEATLLAIADRHPVVDEILEFRAVKKLLSTYIEPFPAYVSPVDGRVHTTFNQALTATGRLSSSNPNLQNIPIRTERGKEIRKAFIPGTPEGVIVSADYSQIELRIMAHLSQDGHLVKAFRDGDDVHAATAAKIYGIPLSEVTREQRGRAKTANFGIMYGISSFGLAQRLHLGRKEAKDLIDGYFASFPAIRSFIDDSIGFARENGYVETLFGRRRYLPDINAKNATVRSLAERNAVNAPIQGTAADIIKLAMIGVDKRLTEAGLKSRMVLQIHDELMFDAVPEEVPMLKKIVVDVMENVLKLSVPLTVECSDLDMPEKELVRRAVAGDQMAYRAIYQLHEKAIRGRVSGYFKWKADVDDVVSESFQKAFTNLPNFDTERELRPWLSTIATRTALDHLASIKREDQKKEGILLKAGEAGLEGQGPLTDVDPEEEIINGENHERLMAFIEELSPLYKEVMIKYMIEELEYEEIAKELKLELNTVRTRIRRGKQQLAEMMLRGEIE